MTKAPPSGLYIKSSKSVTIRDPIENATTQTEPDAVNTVLSDAPASQNVAVDPFDYLEFKQYVTQSLAELQPSAHPHTPPYTSPQYEGHPVTGKINYEQLYIDSQNARISQLEEIAMQQQNTM